MEDQKLTWEKVVKLHSEISNNPNASSSNCEDQTQRNDRLDNGLEMLHDLSNDDIQRYSRQMIVPEIGVKGQMSLRSSRVLIIGAGGLGCPVAIYLAGAGVGFLGIMDFDWTERSNLHRQILHKDKEVQLNKSKAESVREACLALNPEITVLALNIILEPRSEVLEVVKYYDVIVDCSDNPATRYLVNDACVLTGKPLVSGAALKWEGQLTVYNYKGGPCYRCIFPLPAPISTITNCGDGGIVGAVVGIIGSMQAMQTINIIVALETGILSGKLFLYDGLHCETRRVKLRNKSVKCAVCGENPTIIAINPGYDNKVIGLGPMDKVCPSVHKLSLDDRMSVEQFDIMKSNGVQYLLIDVRPNTEFQLCHLTHSQNVQLEELEDDKSVIVQQILRQIQPAFNVIVVCRRGNDSQEGVLRLKKLLRQRNVEASVTDLIGGLERFRDKINHKFPMY